MRLRLLVQTTPPPHVMFLLGGVEEPLPEVLLAQCSGHTMQCWDIKPGPPACVASVSTPTSVLVIAVDSPAMLRPPVLGGPQNLRCRPSIPRSPLSPTHRAWPVSAAPASGGGEVSLTPTASGVSSVSGYSARPLHPAAPTPTSLTEHQAASVPSPEGTLEHFSCFIFLFLEPHSAMLRVDSWLRGF